MKKKKVAKAKKPSGTPNVNRRKRNRHIHCDDSPRDKRKGPKKDRGW